MARDVFDESDYGHLDMITKGRVKVCSGGRYQVVCGEAWDSNDATVVCRQLHYSQYGMNHGNCKLRKILLGSFIMTIGADFKVARNFSIGTHLQVSRSYYNCNGSENFLHECQQEVGCSSEQTAVVICQSM